MATPVAVNTMADDLRVEATRTTTLDGLDALAPPVPSNVVLGVASALVDVAASTVDQVEFDRATLLLARLIAEAQPDTEAVYAAAFAGDRLAAYYVPRVLVDALQSSTGSDDGGKPLTKADARSFACLYAPFCAAAVRDWTKLEAKAGRLSVKELLHTVSHTSPCTSMASAAVSCLRIRCGGCCGAWCRS